MMQTIGYRRHQSPPPAKNSTRSLFRNLWRIYGLW